MCSQISQKLKLSLEEHRLEIEIAIGREMEAMVDTLNPSEDITEQDARETDSSAKKGKKTNAKQGGKTNAKQGKATLDKRAAQLERLKGYVYKCGVRRVWKRELDGLSAAQCILKVSQILKDLGVEGCLVIHNYR